MTPRERAEARARRIAIAIFGARLPGRATCTKLIADALTEAYSRSEAAERRADGARDAALVEVAMIVARRLLKWNEHLGATGSNAYRCVDALIDELDDVRGAIEALRQPLPTRTDPTEAAEASPDV